jgi:hypothetical protein
MKNLFPSVILIGFGLYFFFQNADIPFSYPLFSWPTIIFIVGLAFLLQAYVGKDFEMIIPSILFLGLGIHFHLVQYWNIQFDHIGVIILFIALGFYLRYQKTKSGLFYFWLFLILALIQLFYDRFLNWFGGIETRIGGFHSLWPIILVLVGGYLFFFKRK